MYECSSPTILVDQDNKNKRTEILSRMYGMDFNLIPVNGKHPPCIEWKPFQSQRVAPEQLKEWMLGKYPSKDGTTFWRAKNLNFALLTGSMPWSESNPGTVVIDTDDEEAEELVRRHCPETPMMQITGSGGVHRVWDRPSSNTSPHWLRGTAG